MFARDKHSSLLQKFINYEKSFITLGDKIVSYICILIRNNQVPFSHARWQHRYIVNDVDVAKSSL